MVYWPPEDNNGSNVADAQALLALQQTLYQSKNPTRRWLHCSRRDWIVETLRAHGPVNRALEVGPGSGVYLPTLAEIATDVTAADIEAAYLDQARELASDLPGLECITDDITDSQLPEAAYDLVLCSEVIEHIEDSPAALLGLRQRLAPGGKLVLSTPHAFSPLELTAKIALLPGVIDLVRRIYGEDVMETGHVNLLTERRLKNQLSDAGLEVVSQHKGGMYLPLLAEFGGETAQRWLARLEDRLRDGPLDGLLWTQYYVLQAA
jgi:2-polyprenyl-3-methyl-5-hydroxy-6-metoxy-1,4-benzoquinol methylase